MRTDEVLIGRKIDIKTGRWDFRPFARLVNQRSTLEIDISQN